MRHLSLPTFIMASAVMLAGCTEPGPIRGTIHSNNYKLRLGMTIEEVEAIMAPANYTRFDPKNALIVFRKYIYDEEVGAKFVHVKFENDLVVGESDGHNKVCNLTHSQ
jgi:hypothetical protein